MIPSSPPPTPMRLEDHPAGVEPGTKLMDLTNLPEHGGYDIEIVSGDFRLRLIP